MAEALRLVRNVPLVKDQGVYWLDCHAPEKGDPVFPLCRTRIARKATQPAQAPGLSGTAPVAAGSSAPKVATSGCEAGSSALPQEAPGARPRHKDVGPEPARKAAGSSAHSTAAGSSHAAAAGGHGPPQEAAGSPAQTAPAVRSATSPAALPEGEVQKQTRAKRLAPLVDEREFDLHMITHLPFRSWCDHCVRGKASDDAHVARQEVSTGVPRWGMDYFFLGREPEKVEARDGAASSSHEPAALRP